ncbi:MAG: aldo/keto reductase [Ruminococcus sp.]|nr:aldo/keto reductase [Ruminococcus sp.]
MEYLNLNNGRKIPLVGYGTWTLHGEQCVTCVANAIEVGYRLIDTAQMYENESEVGKAVRLTAIPREELFITTKLYKNSNSYDKAKSAIEKSLNELKMDYVDLMLIHEPYSQSKQMYKALEEAYFAGKIRSIGISNFNEFQYKKLLTACKVTPAVNQVESHIFYPRLSFSKTLKNYGTLMQAWAPFAEGKGNIFENQTLKSIGMLYNKTPAQIALKYLVENNISVIPKTANIQRMKENLDIFDFSLEEEYKQAISSIAGEKSLFGW